MAAADLAGSGAAGRYATALFELAQADNRVDAIEADLNAFVAMLDTSPDLDRLVRSPLYSADAQGKALRVVLDAAGASGTSAAFLMLLARNRRLALLRDIVRGFARLAAEARGETTAEVTSAVPLTPEQTTELENTLRDRLGRQTRLTTRVDPEILGGLIVKVGSRLIDGSIRTKLNSLQLAMKKAS